MAHQAYGGWQANGHLQHAPLVLPWWINPQAPVVQGPYGDVFPAIGPQYPAYKTKAPKTPKAKHGQPILTYPYEQRSGWRGTSARSRA